MSDKATGKTEAYSASSLCDSAAEIAASLGYTPHVLCTEMNCQAREAGKLISSLAKEIAYGENISRFRKPCAIILGGETVANFKDSSQTARDENDQTNKGGRNQELALSSAEGIAGINNLLIFSIASDGSDGKTDAAGGIVDGNTMKQLKEKGINLQSALDNNDSYNALAAVDGLIKTGPTGINVNDVAVVLAG